MYRFNKMRKLPENPTTDDHILVDVKNADEDQLIIWAHNKGHNRSEAAKAELNIRNTKILEDSHKTNTDALKKNTSTIKELLNKNIDALNHASQSSEEYSKIVILLTWTLIGIGVWQILIGMTNVYTSYSNHLTLLGAGIFCCCLGFGMYISKIKSSSVKKYETKA